VRSYTDQIGASSVPQFKQRAHDLATALNNIASELGDGVDSSGVPDYLIRFADPGIDDANATSVPHVFLVVVRPACVTVMQRIGQEILREAATFGWDEKWFDGILGAFESFRASLETDRP